MALSSKKIITYANPVANLPDHPSQAGFTAAQLKAVFDAKANEEIKAAINGIIDDLIAVIDSASGADNIGATAITDLDGATVQALLESIRNKLKSVIDSSSGADFIGATAISGLTGATVQALLEALKAYIDTHKTSTDHDSRYYTETELNAIDGIKGSAVIGTPVISGVSGTTVKEQLASLKSLITSVILGQISDDSLTNAKLGSDVKVGSLAELITTVKTNLVAAINEVKEQNNDLDAKIGTIETQTILENYLSAHNIPSTAKRGKLDVKLKGMSAVNKVKNGNFVNTNNWYSHSLPVAFSVSNGEAVFLADSSGDGVYQNVSMLANHKNYVCADVKSTSNATQFGFSWSKDSHSGSGKYERLSSIHTVDTDTSDWLMALDIRSSGFDNIYFKNVMCIDLTALFGAGNEPDLATCDKLFNIYFEGLQGSTGIKAVSCGKNLINLPSIFVYDIPGGSNISYRILTFKVKHNTDYTLKGNFLKSTAVNGFGGYELVGSNNVPPDVSSWFAAEALGLSRLLVSEQYDLPVLNSFNTGNNSYISLYLGISGTATTFTLTDWQIEENTVATLYEPYKSTDVEYKTFDGKTITLHRLPNGVYDEITEDGKYIKRIAEYTLVASDITLFSQMSNVVAVGANIPNDYIGSGTDPSVNKGSVIVQNFTWKAWSDALDRVNTFHYITDTTSRDLGLVVAIGTYADFAAAQAALAGTKIIYQLAQPQILDTNATPLIAEPGGQVSVIPTSSPQPSAEFSYPLNLGAVIDGLLEAQKQHSELLINQNAINLDYDLRITALEP